MADTGVQGIMNVPAVAILFVLSAVLIRGTQESAFVNNLIVIAKVAIVLLVITIGWGFIDPANHTPYIPEATQFTTRLGVTHQYGGLMGVLGAAGVAAAFAFTISLGEFESQVIATSRRPSLRSMKARNASPDSRQLPNECKSSAAESRISNPGTLAFDSPTWAHRTTNPRSHSRSSPPPGSWRL